MSVVTPAQLAQQLQRAGIRVSPRELQQLTLSTKVAVFRQLLELQRKSSKLLQFLKDCNEVELPAAAEVDDPDTFTKEDFETVFFQLLATEELAPLALRPEDLRGSREQCYRGILHLLSKQVPEVRQAR